MGKVEVNAENYKKQQIITNTINDCLNKIEQETGMCSNHSQVLKHASFITLLNMGDVIVNYLFHIIFEKGSSWTLLILLDSIAKNKPVIPKEHLGKFKHQTVDWTSWYLKSEYYQNNNIYYNLI